MEHGYLYIVQAFDSRLRIDLARPINVSVSRWFKYTNTPCVGRWIWCWVVWLCWWPWTWAGAVHFYQRYTSMYAWCNCNWPCQAWNNVNLQRLAEKIKSPLVLYVYRSAYWRVSGHVRASTAGALSETNCHPWRYGRLMWYVCSPLIGSGCIMARYPSFPKLSENF